MLAKKPDSKVWKPTAASVTPGTTHRMVCVYSGCPKPAALHCSTGPRSKTIPNRIARMLETSPLSRFMISKKRSRRGSGGINPSFMANVLNRIANRIDWNPYRIARLAKRSVWARYAGDSDSGHRRPYPFRPMSTAPFPRCHPAIVAEGHWWRNESESLSLQMRPRMIGRAVPPASAESYERCGGILKPLPNSLDVTQSRLLVLIVGDQDLEIIDGAGLIICLDQMQLFSCCVQRPRLRAESLGVMLQCVQRIRNLGKSR